MKLLNKLFVRFFISNRVNVLFYKVAYRRESFFSELRYITSDEELYAIKIEYISHRQEYDKLISLAVKEHDLEKLGLISLMLTLFNVALQASEIKHSLFNQKQSNLENF